MIPGQGTKIPQAMRCGKKKSHLNYREGDKAEMGHATEEMGVGTESPWTEEPGGLQSMGSQELDMT